MAGTIADFLSSLSQQQQQDIMNGIAQSGQNAAATTMGYFDPNGYPAGTQTLGGAQTSGMLQGYPTAAVQNEAGYFGPNMSYLSNTPTAAQTAAAGFVNLPKGSAFPGAVSQLPTTQVQEDLGTIAPDQATLRQIMGLAPDYYTGQPNGGGAATQFSVADVLASPGYQNWVLQQKAENPNFNPNAPFGGMGSSTLQAEQLYGNAAGSQANPNTLEAQTNTGYIGGTGLGENGGGVATTTEQQLQQQGGLGVLNLIGSLSGPENAFQQQAVLNGLDSTGLSKAVGAIQGKYGLPTFQAPQANPQAATIQGLMNQVSAGTNMPGFAGSGGSSKPVYSSGALQAVQNPDGTYSVPTNATGAPSTVDGGTAAYLNALPAPNKINAPNFLKLDPDTQKFLLSAYGAAGYSPTSIGNSLKATLPSFKAPAAGSIAA